MARSMHGFRGAAESFSDGKGAALATTGTEVGAKTETETGTELAEGRTPRRLL